jgi:hypothetical protein
MKTKRYIIANLCSVNGRSQSLFKTLESLYHQVDEIRLVLNGYPKENQMIVQLSPKITIVHADNSRGDAEKFYFIGEDNAAQDYHRRPVYQLVCDDDITYPENFAQVMCDAVDKYHKQAIVGLHGIILKPLPAPNYYNHRTVYWGFRDLEQDTPVHMVATCALAFFNKTLKGLSMQDFPVRNMGDIWLGLYLQKHQIPSICLKHKGDWMKYNAEEMKGVVTIFDQKYKKDETVDTEAINSIPEWKIFG